MFTSVRSGCNGDFGEGGNYDSLCLQVLDLVEGNNGFLQTWQRHYGGFMAEFGGYQCFSMAASGCIIFGGGVVQLLAYLAVVNRS